MHEVEPFTDTLWICTGCGKLFDRTPMCHGCTKDPTMRYHQCEFESARIEGECEEDPILTLQEV